MSHGITPIKHDRRLRLPGTWRMPERDELTQCPGLAAVYRCPTCGVQHLAAPSEPITRQGVVAHTITCYVGDCPFVGKISLTGWGRHGR